MLIVRTARFNPGKFQAGGWPAIGGCNRLGAGANDLSSSNALTLYNRQLYCRLSRHMQWEGLRWSRSFGPFEGFVKVYSGCETTPSSSVWYLIIDDDELWESCGLMSESAKRGGEPREGVRGHRR